MTRMDWYVRLGFVGLLLLWLVLMLSGCAPTTQTPLEAHDTLVSFCAGCPEEASWTTTSSVQPTQGGILVVTSNTLTQNRSDSRARLRSTVWCETQIGTVRLEWPAMEETCSMLDLKQRLAEGERR